MSGTLNDLINNFSSPEEQWNAHVIVPIGDTPIGVSYNSAASTADSSAGAHDAYAVGVQIGDFHTGVGAATDGGSEGPHSDVFSSLGLDAVHGLDLGHLDSVHL
jgi:hypothetical protein